MREEIKTEIISWIKTILLAVAFAFFVNNVIIVNARVPTGSMENNIMPEDRLVAFRLSYLFSEPERFDVVVFEYPDSPPDRIELFVKRVIGLPGETVTIKGGKVYINDSLEPLPDYFIKAPQNDKGSGVYVVPEGCYFMLGDNRNGSSDSREWINKYVSKDKILGKAIFRYFPKISLFKDIED